MKTVTYQDLTDTARVSIEVDSEGDICIETKGFSYPQDANTAAVVAFFRPSDAREIAACLIEMAERAEKGGAR
ncbi:hypothetical protein [Deinococcus navajonensis]|uniref:Uncharacterized protein n=1 Tax=Deinococcus navajonensis TaxID=309884 RepID=A0ABV8XIQ2_9DEIO